ncbi:MAG: protein kinase domain-containing protein [Candidatus Sumerlaeaceae bacterium]
MADHRREDILGSGAGAHRNEEISSEAPTVERATPADLAAPVEWARALRSYIPTLKIAEGGFSEIWEAVQVELGRVVAIKRLKKRTDKTGKPSPIAPRHITMFRQEAVVAAHLEHPNILPVYDLEYDADGLPFLVMKRVRGEPWGQVLNRDFDTLAPRTFLAKHLPILVALARAVAYAHSEGIVHRDLKPAQVMIGSFGEVLLMDWGLAMAYPRRVDDPDAPPWLRDPNAPINRPLNPAGTPTYMAPEQTESTVHKLGPWTDVYLLGGILYRILTGSPPHVGADGSSTFRLAQAGIVEPPTRLAPGREMPPELVELAMKALEPKPENRLQSAEEFLQALEDYLIGADKQRESILLAISARDRLADLQANYDTLANAINFLERALVLWPDNMEAAQWRTEAIKRYARLAITNKDLKLARVQAERLPESDERAQLLDEISRLEAIESQRDAELAVAHERVRQERNRAEHLVIFLVGDLTRQLRRIGRVDILADLCQQTIQYLEKLATEDEAPAVLVGRVQAFLNIADVELARGDSERAAQACHRALELLAKIPSEQIDLLQRELFRAESWRRLGHIAYLQGKYDQAKTAYECGCEALKSASGVAIPVAEKEASMAMLLHGLGIVLWRQRRFEEALAYHIEAETLITRLCRTFPSSEPYVETHASVLATLGNCYRDLGELEFAISVTQEALRLWERLYRLDMGNLSRLSNVLWVRNNLALLLLLKGDQSGAKSLFLANRDAASRLIEHDPENLQYVRDLGFALSIAGEISYMQGALEEARALLQEALVVAKEILSREPESIYAGNGVARAHGQLGEVLLAIGDQPAATDHLRAARDKSGAMLERAPENINAVKTWVRATLLLTLLGKAPTTPMEKLYAEVRQSLSQITAPCDELDRWDNEAAFALACGDLDKAREFMDKLAKRNWLAPALVRLACAQGGPA